MKRMKSSSLWWGAILTIIVVIIAILIIWNFLPSGTTYKDESYLYQRALTNAASETDNNYFKSILFALNGPEIHVTESFVNPASNNGISSISYVVKMSGASFSQWQNNEFLIPNIQPQLTYFQLLEAASKNTAGNISIAHTGIVQPNFFLANLWNFLPMLVMIIIFASMFIYARRMSNGSNGAGGAGMFNPGRNQAQKINSKVKFSDVAGNTEVKEEVMELVDYLKNPNKYAAAGAKIPKGILLGGPPGTGKTLIAKATAGEAGVPFFFISASNFVEMYVGVGAKRVRELFKDARKSGKAIIFIDELDAVGRSRGTGLGGGNDEREQTLNQLLVEMDGMEENTGILVIAATNRTDVLDPALQRPGRFDRSINVNLPDVKEREEILKLHAKGKKLSPEIKFKNIAKRTPGYSGAQLANVINEASILSVREKTAFITPDQIDEAIDRVMSGPAKKNRVITEEERTMVAYHEAGHAVVGIRLAGGTKVQKITIIPRGFAGGYNLMLPEHEKYNETKRGLESSIASFMGGRAAEEIIYGKEEISTGAANDIEKATKIARRMVTEFGMSALGPIQYEEAQGSPFLGRDYNKHSAFSQVVANEIDTEVRKIILHAEEIAKKTIKANMDLLELIKNELLEKETIVAEEIEYLAKNLKPLPKKEKEVKKEVEYKPHSLDDLIGEVQQEKKEKRNHKDEESLKDETENK
ncbi:ATP-dependent zinc metalloprotease FtsH [Mycoplasma iguanae]|uniref:ATP-dependent zinc metalloprotease FtsH n=1 Tax=Mycoplasma iguanae TaxID=292461 RepID=A0ABY5R8I0_9MOLU|nr:ATP-dependent zinc metalloprotease FtsH [Mycoplasma iguanae]UVD81748.1 ATP-dependent zinc metalloprotease FtsH [Mycoplasma iguanae]